MSGPSFSSTATEWLNAATSAAEKSQSGGCGVATGGGDGERDLKRNYDSGGSNGAGGGRDACGGDGGYKTSCCSIGVDPCRCDCGEVK